MAVGCQETASTLYQLKLSEFAARFAEVALLGCRELGTWSSDKAVVLELVRHYLEERGPQV